MAIIKYGCDYCNKVFDVLDECEKHEKECEYNKETNHCYTCKNWTWKMLGYCRLYDKDVVDGCSDWEEK